MTVSRRQFITGISTAVTSAAYSKRRESPESQRPNLVFLMADELRYDALGCSGNPDAVTPQIDRLAAEGVFFKSCYVSQPLCSPCRSSIFTGMFPHRTGVVDNKIPLLDHSTSFPRLLKESAYTTAYIGKWHLGPKKGKTLVYPPPYFDVWEASETEVSHWIGPWGRFTHKSEFSGPTVPVNTAGRPDFGGQEPGIYRSDMETAQAIEFIRANRSRPFCLCVSYYPPHASWTAPLRNLRHFDGVDFPTYYAMVNNVDENIARIAETLDELNLRERTLIVFTTDHGHFFKYRWNQNAKRVCYDPASRVPLIMNWKGKIKPRVCSELISLVDLAPTLLELCNVPIPPEIQGRSAKDLLETRSPDWREAVFIQNRPYADINNGMFERCVVTPSWKLILNSQRPPELYHRQEDPQEVNNRYSDLSLKEVREDLLARLDAWAWRVGDGLTLKWRSYLERTLLR